MRPDSGSGRRGRVTPVRTWPIWGLPRGLRMYIIAAVLAILVAIGLAARAGLGFASDVTAISWADGPRARRGAYGDKLQAELEFPGKTCTLLTVRPGIFPVAAAASGSAPVRAVSVEVNGVKVGGARS